ncbi:MAG: tRNA preQ1(34) S-adenosylmethionine ribosyltransferase-isomerase QueA [Acidobacteriota bacterium]|nr:tRNA preQ1(34) S-adenosylmethionine ribosyltransferase-isomerase QueA [Acidobacteriota bacterium]
MSSPEFDHSEFDYRLPEELIAQQPLADRAGARMLVLYRDKLGWEDRMFRDFPSFLRPGDCLVLNNSKVFPSRLYGRIGTGAVEVFLLRPVSEDGKTWQALVRPGRKVRVGDRIQFDDVQADIIARGEYGERTLRFHTDKDIFGLLDSIGHVPLPPYIKRPDTSEDRQRYQTVFAEHAGSVAAPTAGLHFTSGILEACRAAGAEIAPITLHVGLGTFQPVRQAGPEAKLHSEEFHVPAGSASSIQSAILSGRRVICAGTTSVRAVESMLLGKRGETDLFIRPGFHFRGAGAMLTNFHLPQSSLLMLVCAFAGREFVLSAYQHAVESGYRFYSYGDCMLIV